MKDVFIALVGSIVGIFGSTGGIWIYLAKRSNVRNATTQLIMGLAHDKITYFGMKYIDRGYVTIDEYDDLVNYFYNPYKALGGNGTAERIIHAVERLPHKPERSHLAAITETTLIRATDRTSSEGEHNDEHPSSY